MLPEIGATLLFILEELAVLLLSIAPTLINAILRVFDMMLDGLNEHMPGIIDKLVTLIIVMITAIGTTLESRAPELRDALNGFFDSIWNAIFTIFGLDETVAKGVLIGKNIIQSVWDGIKEKWESVKTWFGTKIDDISGWFSGAWDDFKSIGSDIVRGIIQGVNDLWNDVKKTFQDLANALPKWIKDVLGIKSPSTVFTNIGKEMINGLISGITGLWDNIKKEVEKLGNKLPDWMKKVLGIKSPSKVFAEIGEFIDMGLVKGIDDNSGDVHDSVSGLADEAADGARDSGLAGVLSNLIETLNGDFDNEFVIKPVLDLSEIQNGKNKLRDMMSGINGYDLSGSNIIASRTRDEINKDSRRIGNDMRNSMKQEIPNSEVINNTFNITGSNAKEIADEVSRVLQIQVDRRKAKWAL